MLKSCTTLIQLAFGIYVDDTYYDTHLLCCSYLVLSAIGSVVHFVQTLRSRDLYSAVPITSGSREEHVTACLLFIYTCIYIYTHKHIEKYFYQKYSTKVKNVNIRQ